jgi:hypothetical protein
MRIVCGTTPLPARPRHHEGLSCMALTPELRRGIDAICDYLFGVGCRATINEDEHYACAGAMLSRPT